MARSKPGLDIVAQNITLMPRLSNLLSYAITIENITDDEERFDGQ